MIFKPKQFKLGKINILYIDWFEISKYLIFLDGIFSSVGVWGIFMLNKGKKMGLAVVITSFLLHLIIMQIVNLLRKDILEIEISN